MFFSGTPLVRPSFFPQKMAFQEGWPLVRGRNQKGFHCIYKANHVMTINTSANLDKAWALLEKESYDKT